MCFEKIQQGGPAVLGWCGVRAAKSPGSSGYNCKLGDQGNPCSLRYSLSERPSADL